MLDSVKIQRRQSEIRQTLAELVGKEALSDDETRKMDDFDTEYRSNEARYRAALISEDEERREAKDDLETRSDREWAELMGRFELRQVALALDEGRALSGATAEIVGELREAGGYRGVPVPWEALEVRVGETTASGVPDPIQMRPIIDRLFPESVAAKMGAEMITIDHGLIEWPVVTSDVTVAWQSTETGNVAGPTRFQTTDRAMVPNYTVGIQIKITRRALKQTGAALEQAVRRDMNGAIQAELDRVVFLGAGASGEPLGVITGAATYGITSTAVAAASTWAAFRAGVTRFLTANAATGPGSVNALIRPELWDSMDGAYVDTGVGLTEWDRLLKSIPAGNVVMSPNALAAPAGTPLAVTALLTTRAGGIAPIFVGKWGAIDMIRDPYTDAHSGGLRITGLATLDVTVARPAQLELLTGLEV